MTLLLGSAWAAYALLAPGGVLHDAADGRASAAWTGAPLALELLSDEGEWLRVRTHDRGHCYPVTSQARLVRAEAWVRRADLAPVLAEPVRLEGETGWTELAPGVAVVEGRALLPVGDPLPLDAPQTLLYEPTDGPCVVREEGPAKLVTGLVSTPLDGVPVRTGEPLYSREGEVVGRVVQDGQLSGAPGGCMAPFGGELLFCEPSFVVVRDDVVLRRSPSDTVGVRYGRGSAYLAMQYMGREAGRVRVAFPQQPDSHCHGARGLPAGLSFWVDEADLQAVTTATGPYFRPGAVITAEHLDTGRMLFAGQFPADSGVLYRPDPLPPLPAETSVVADDEGWLGDWQGEEVHIARGDQVSARQVDRRVVRAQDRCASVELKTWKSQIRPFYEPEFADPVVPLTGMSTRLPSGQALFYVEGASAGYAREELKVQEVEGACGTLVIGEGAVRVCW